MARTTKTRAYVIKGKDVHTAHAGASVQFPVFETREHELAACKTEADCREMFQSAFDVWLQGRVRGWAGAKNEDGTPKYSAAQIQEKIDAAVYERRQEGTGTKKEPGEIRKMKDERAEQIATLRRLRAEKPRDWEKMKQWTPAGIVAAVEAPDAAEAVTA